jgi:hypothetical protein
MAEKNLGNDWATKISEPGLFAQGYITSPNLEGSEIEPCAREFEAGLLASVRELAEQTVSPHVKEDSDMAHKNFDLTL